MYTKFSYLMPSNRRYRTLYVNAELDKQVAHLYFKEKKTQAEVAKIVGMSRSWVGQSVKRGKERTDKETVLVNVDHRAEMLTKYAKAEQDIQRLQDEMLGRLFPDAKGPHGLEMKPDRHNLLLFSEAFGRLMDRKLKIYLQVATLLGLNTLNINETTDIGPRTLEAFRHLNASNGDRAGHARWLRENTTEAQAN